MIPDTPAALCAQAEALASEVNSIAAGRSASSFLSRVPHKPGLLGTRNGMEAEQPPVGFGNLSGKGTHDLNISRPPVSVKDESSGSRPHPEVSCIRRSPASGGRSQILGRRAGCPHLFLIIPGCRLQQQQWPRGNTREIPGCHTSSLTIRGKPVAVPVLLIDNADSRHRFSDGFREFMTRRSGAAPAHSGAIGAAAERMLLPVPAYPSKPIGMTPR
jgi:hypothetical protein